MQQRRIGQKCFDTTAAHNDTFAGNRVIECVLQSGNPSKIVRAIVAAIRVYMIDDMFFCRFRAMKGRSHDNMNTNGRNLHVSMFIIGLTKSPKIIIFTRPFTITGIPENSSIISDSVFFVFIDTLDLLFEIINIHMGNESSIC